MELNTRISLMKWELINFRYSLFPFLSNNLSWTKKMRRRWWWYMYPFFLSLYSLLLVGYVYHFPANWENFISRSGGGKLLGIMLIRACYYSVDACILIIVLLVWDFPCSQFMLTLFVSPCRADMPTEWGLFKSQQGPLVLSQHG